MVGHYWMERKWTEEGTKFNVVWHDGYNSVISEKCYVKDKKFTQSENPTLLYYTKCLISLNLSDMLNSGGLIGLKNSCLYEIHVYDAVLDIKILLVKIFTHL